MLQNQMEIPSISIGLLHVHAISLCDARQQILEASLSRDGLPRLVVTPNISHFDQARKYEVLRTAYARAWLSLPDGWPVAKLVGRLTGRRQDRVTGSDLVAWLCEQAISVALIGGRDQTAVLAAANARTKNADLDIRCIETAPPEELANITTRSAMIKRIAASDPDCVFLGLGVPKQERFALDLLEHLGGGVVLCVGASLEFLAGTDERAPVIVQRLGLEWLHRLSRNPRKLAKRYLLAAPYFVKIAASARLR